MTKSPITTLEFCPGCGVLLPVPEERTLNSNNDPVCGNCHTSTPEASTIKGQFLVDDAEKMRCL